MTDKEQIMIDGVDILKEKINMCFILLLNKLETPETIEQTIYEHLDAFVKEWNDELVHKTQECESLKEEIEVLKDNFDTATRDCNELIEELKQECEELKRKLSNQEQLYENEIEIYNNSCLQLRQENDDLYLERLALNTANSGINALLEVKEQECDRYLKALEEIEEVCLNDIHTFADGTAVRYDALDDILNIINKAKGEGICQ